MIHGLGSDDASSFALIIIDGVVLEIAHSAGLRFSRAFQPKVFNLDLFERFIS